MRRVPQGFVKKPAPADRESTVGVAPVPVSLDAAPTARFLFRQTGILSNIEVRLLDGNPASYWFELASPSNITTHEFPANRQWDGAVGFEITPGTMFTVKVPEGCHAVVGALFTPRAAVRVARTQKDTVHA